VRTATTAPAGSASRDSRSSISRPVPTPSAPPSTRADGSGKGCVFMSVSPLPVAGQPLPLDGLEQHPVAAPDGRFGPGPAFQTFQVHEAAPAGVVVAHAQQGFGPAPAEVFGEVGQGGESAIAVAGRGPDRP